MPRSDAIYFHRGCVELRTWVQTHKAHPDSSGGELDQGHVVFGILFVSRGYGAVVLDFAEEAFDCVAQFVERGVEDGMSDPIRHGLDIGHDAALFHCGAQDVGVVGPVGKQDLASLQTVEHISGAASVVGLTRRDLEQDRQTVGIDQRMDLGRQPAS